MEDELDYKKLYENEKTKSESYKAKLDAFSLPSKTRLFYALNKHQNDWAGMLNQIDVSSLNIDDPKDKSVERLKIIYGLIGANAPLVDLLQNSAGVTGNEKEDMANRAPFIERIATKREF